MNAKTHKRSSSYGRKSSMVSAKTPRPIPRRGHSYSQAHSASGSGRVTSGHNAKSHTELQQEESEDDAMSFLQFCATCEKQISSPSTNVLYCSEVCRQKDVSKLTPLPLTLSPAVSLISLPSYFEHHSTPDIVPRMSPTAPRPVSMTFSDLTLSSPASPIEEEGCDDSQSYSSLTRNHVDRISDLTYDSLRADRKEGGLDETNTGTPTHRPRLRLSFTSEELFAKPTLHNKPPI